ncbi:hypothetical protein HNO88_004295 [Novosphingobium chloroacetimidivorans]|uniref:Uncharacterized protein n=1 Tax=Novosphingobium chloroacetimidivorans TaxID=1428314 RepID=A0A7W7KEU3_9SPHN|nr:hypothetical protein [Novosphingobium chloroacetimidivorans]MBB4860949.1 hypothetical protein [Novosphingobium chloroacetimidivorans]
MHALLYLRRTTETARRKAKLLLLTVGLGPRLAHGGEVWGEPSNHLPGAAFRLQHRTVLGDLARAAIKHHVGEDQALDGAGIVRNEQFSLLHLCQNSPPVLASRSKLDLVTE